MYRFHIYPTHNPPINSQKQYSSSNQFHTHTHTTTHMHTHTSTVTHTHSDTRTVTHTHSDTHAQWHTRTVTHIQSHTQSYTHTQTRTHTHKYTCTHWPFLVCQMQRPSSAESVLHHPWSWPQNLEQPTHLQEPTCTDWQKIWKTHMKMIYTTTTKLGTSVQKK